MTMRHVISIAVILLFLPQIPVRGQASTRPAVSTSPDSSDKSNPLTDPNNKTITIATFNINWGNPDVREVVKTIRKAKADVVCLQETTRLSERFIKSSLKKEYPYQHFRGDKGEFRAERFGYLSKYPLKKFRYLPAKHGIFGTWIAEPSVFNQKIQLVNVHMEPFRGAKINSARDLWRAFRKQETIHAAEIKYIIDHLDKQLPILVLGDFNSISSLCAPTYLRSLGYVDSFASVTENADHHPTWEWMYEFGRVRFRIDYVFHSSEFETLSSRVIQTDASDHYLLVSKMVIKINEIALPTQGGKNAIIEKH